MDNNKLIETVVAAFIKEVTKNSKEILGELWDEGKVFIGVGLKKYLIEKYKKYNKIKTILNGSTPVDFYDVYYGLDLIGRARDKSKKDKEISTKDIKSVFEDDSCVTIIGDAGGGKSTLVKHLFMQSLSQRFLIPVLIELRYIELKEISFIEYLKNIISDSDIVNNERIIDRMLKSGEFVFFLDGFDEISADNEEGIIKGIDEFTSKYNKNKYILTTRPHSNGEDIPNFTNYRISPLSMIKGDIQKFIDLQLKDEVELAEKIKDSVSGGVDKYIKSFLTNPLLLSLYILTYQNNAEIPSKKYIFYRRVINTLFSEHDSKSKLGYVRDRRTALTQVEFEKVLKSFCFLAYFDAKYTFDHDYVEGKLEAVKNNNKSLIFNTYSFIYDMKVSVSLWLDDGGSLSFAHRSLQEYFAALFVKDLVDSNKQAIYAKLLLHCEQRRGRAQSEIENFLSLCEEMDAVYFYKYYYLPLTKELFKSIKIGDMKNSLRNFVLFFSEGMVIHDSRTRRNDVDVMVNDKVYKSIYIHIEHTRKLYEDLRVAGKCEVLPSTDVMQASRRALRFSDTEGLLDRLVERLMDAQGVKLITGFLEYLESEIEEKEQFIRDAVQTDIRLIEMV